MVGLVALAACSHEAAEGRPWVRSVDIEGNQAFSDKEIRAGLATQRTSWLPFSTKQYFDPAAFDYDLKRVESFYADRGYFDARVVAHEVIPHGSEAVDVRIHVDEGAPTAIDRVTLDGVDALSPSEVDAARRLLADRGLRPGRTFDYDRYSTARQDLLDKLRADGYAYAQVKGQVSVARHDHRAYVALYAVPGPLVRYGNIRLLGPTLAPRQVLHTLTFRSGDRFRSDDFPVSQGRLYGLGMFSSVRIALPTEAQENPDVFVHLSPAPLRELRLGVGVGVERQRNEVRVRGEWLSHNFLGGARTLRLRLRPGYVALPNGWNTTRSGPTAYNDLELTQPDLFSAGFTGNALVGFDLGIDQAYQYWGPRAQLGVQHPLWQDRILLGAAWNLQWLHFYNIDAALFDPARTQLGFGFQNPYRLAYVEGFAQIDLRDRPFDPRKGAFFSLRVEGGGPELGGTFRYVKLTPEARGYVPLGGRVVLAGRALFGWLLPNQMDESPVTRRYALGGPSSQRGFGFGRLAPQVFDPQTGHLVPVGGDGEALFSAEARIDVMKIADNWVGVVPFLDAGDVTPTVSEMNLAQLHYATGLDLNYDTPVGVARVGLGIRLNRLSPFGPNGLPNPDPGLRYAFHFTIGQAF
jgi:translocation and assembly module TamA